MEKNWEDFIYKKVSLWTSIIALLGVVITATFFVAGIQTELALINQKLDNHISHMGEVVDENNKVIKENRDNVVKLKVDIAEIKALLK